VRGCSLARVVVVGGSTFLGVVLFTWAVLLFSNVDAGAQAPPPTSTPPVTPAAAATQAASATADSDGDDAVGGYGNAAMAAAAALAGSVVTAGTLWFKEGRTASLTKERERELRAHDEAIAQANRRLADVREARVGLDSLDAEVTGLISAQTAGLTYLKAVESLSSEPSDRAQGFDPFVLGERAIQTALESRRAVARAAAEFRSTASSVDDESLKAATSEYLGIVYNLIRTSTLESLSSATNRFQDLTDQLRARLDQLEQDRLKELKQFTVPRAA
jgi:hypothetical protein